MFPWPCERHRHGYAGRRLASSPRELRPTARRPTPTRGSAREAPMVIGATSRWASTCASKLRHRDVDRLMAYASTGSTAKRVNRAPADPTSATLPSRASPRGMRAPQPDPLGPAPRRRSRRDRAERDRLPLVVRLLRPRGARQPACVPGEADLCPRRRWPPRACTAVDRQGQSGRPGRGVHVDTNLHMQPRRIAKHCPCPLDAAGRDQRTLDDGPPARGAAVRRHRQRGQVRRFENVPQHVGPVRRTTGAR